MGLSNLKLLSGLTRVETPFINVTIGDYTFGTFERVKNVSGKQQEYRTTYPNYIQRLNIQKINGKVNTYTLIIDYPVQNGDDPNFFEKIFSSVSTTRKVRFSYGDMSIPSYYYKEEEALITKIKNNIDISNNKMTYTLTATGSGIYAKVGVYTFPEVTMKGSELIIQVLNDERYGLKDIFYGMRNLGDYSSLIPDDDKEITIEGKEGISPLDYIAYVVNCMLPDNNEANSLNKGFYVLTVVDSIGDEYAGPYFKITKVSNREGTGDALDVYEIDIGYPNDNIVTSFTIDNDESYSLIYDYFSEKINDAEYATRIDDNGNLVEIYAPIISSSNEEHKTTEADRTWWSKVTNFPIKASITFKGLLRPAILMTKVRLNVYFYGRKHISSGLYVINSETDDVDGNGFKTTLTMTRISGDSDYQ